MLTGCRIIGSVATARTLKPSGSLNRLTASSGVRASAERLVAVQNRSANSARGRRMGGTPCGRLEIEDAAPRGEMQEAREWCYRRRWGEPRSLLPLWAITYRRPNAKR